MLKLLTVLLCVHLPLLSYLCNAIGHMPSDRPYHSRSNPTSAVLSLHSPAHIYLHISLMNFRTTLIIFNYSGNEPSVRIVGPPEIFLAPEVRADSAGPLSLQAGASRFNKLFFFQQQR